MSSMETADLVLFTEEILNGKLHFLGSAWAICCKKSFLLNRDGPMHMDFPEFAINHESQ